MMNCNVITYRLKRDVHPSAVLAALNELLQKFDLSYKRCLWSLSNYSRDDIQKIVRDYPQLSRYYQVISGDDRPDIHLLCNFQQPDFAATGPDQGETIRKVLCEVPVSYHVGTLEYYLDGVSFGESQRIRETPFGPPKGSYIAYSREFHGDERHSCILLATEYSGEKQPALFREFFFELSKTLPGTYEGTQILFE